MVGDDAVLYARLRRRLGRALVDGQLHVVLDAVVLRRDIDDIAEYDEHERRDERQQRYPCDLECLFHNFLLFL